MRCLTLIISTFSTGTTGTRIGTRKNACSFASRNYSRNYKTTAKCQTFFLQMALGREIKM